jgi:[ribosomal protein S5]-alanine N-acetyltransferase
MSPAPERAFPSPPRLETERLILRTPVQSDAHALRDYYLRNDHRFARWSESRVQKDHERWIGASAASRHELTFLALAHGDAELVAVVTLHGFTMGQQPQAMLAYTVDGAYEGRGFASEAVRRVVQYAREQRGVRALSAYYDPENARSERLLQRLGFAFVHRTPVVPGFEKLMRVQNVAVLHLP